VWQLLNWNKIIFWSLPQSVSPAYEDPKMGRDLSHNLTLSIPDCILWWKLLPWILRFSKLSNHSFVKEIIKFINSVSWWNSERDMFTSAF
jgi:hypothetical protein